jgi:hypothetical protein
MSRKTRQPTQFVGNWMGPLEAGVAEVLHDAYVSSGSRAFEWQVGSALGLVKAVLPKTNCFCSPYLVPGTTRYQILRCFAHRDSEGWLGR